MNILKYILLLFVITSCKTYNQFYSKTYEDLFLFEEVYRLDLSFYKRQINLSKFRDLKMLNLSNLKNENELESILKSIPNPEGLEVLILDNNHLKSLPNSILRFKQLKHISLNKNPALDLNIAFKTLSKLPITFLNLQFNQLKYLPPSITMLRKLEEVNLSNNQLNTGEIFNYLSQLPYLKTLWLRNNELKVIEAELNKMSRLVNLYLENNQLLTLPINLNGLKSLRILSLSFNKFQVLPVSLQSIPHLILLHIDNCEIEKIPNSFSPKSSTIKGLVINNNQLSEQAIKKWKRVFKSFFLLIF